jgi:alpha-ketoglutaric semialdehyde dehydrogenase
VAAPAALNYIGTTWRDGGGEDLVDLNPAHHHEVVATTRAATDADVEEAAEQASVAAVEWAAASPVLRSRVLLAVAAAIESDATGFALDLAREEGKTLREAEAEVRRGVHVFRYYAGALVTGVEPAHPSERPGFRIENRREPLGVVALLTPWNFPFAIPAWKLAPALAAGNAVLIKPAPQTPLSAANLVRCVISAGVPDGLVQLLQGGLPAGQAVAEHLRVSAISFTGSTRGGQALYRAAAQRYVAMQGELGGNNALVVLEDAPLDEAVAIAVDGAFSSTGQKCTATRRVLVQESVYPEFVDRFVAAARSLRLGDPTEANTDIGPVISAEQLALDDAGVQRARAEGATVRCGGEVAHDKSEGWYFVPTVLTDVDPQSATGQEELFGPISSVFPVRDLDHAIALANATPYGLSAAICTRDLVAAERFVRTSETGVVSVNAATAGIEVQAPLKGVKASGVGPAEQGREALDFFTRPKAVYRNFPGLTP